MSLNTPTRQVSVISGRGGFAASLALTEQSVLTRLTLSISLSTLSERQRCAMWIKKLCDPATCGSGLIGCKNRNIYARLLLQMLKRGVLEGPFTSKPQAGSLKTLPAYMVTASLSKSVKIYLSIMYCSSSSFSIITMDIHPMTHLLYTCVFLFKSLVNLLWWTIERSVWGALQHRPAWLG